VTWVTAVADVASDVTLSAVILGDVDNNAGFTLTLMANRGAFNVVPVTVTGIGALVLSGLASEIDAYLNPVSAIHYTGAQDVAGDAVALITLTSINGLGDDALGSVGVNITNVNDARTLTNLSALVATDEEVAGDVDLSGITLRIWLRTRRCLADASVNFDQTARIWSPPLVS
jgi:hypothetical protein